jgi:hypothetical protein
VGSSCIVPARRVKGTNMEFKQSFRIHGKVTNDSISRHMFLVCSKTFDCLGFILTPSSCRSPICRWEIPKQREQLCVYSASGESRELTLQRNSTRVHSGQRVVCSDHFRSDHLQLHECIYQLFVEWLFAEGKEYRATPLPPHSILWFPASSAWLAPENH